MLLVALLLPTLVSAGTVLPLAGENIDCSRYNKNGEEYVTFEQLSGSVDLYTNEYAKCSKPCTQVFQVSCADEELTDDAKRIVKAVCNKEGSTYGCTYLDKDNGKVEVAMSGVKLEKQRENKHCILKGSMSTAFSMDFGTRNKILIIVGSVLGVLVLAGCGIACFCGACCCRRRY